MVKESILFAGYDFQDRKIEISANYAQDLPKVTVDAERFSRSLLNISRNAFQATPNGGTITLETGTRNRRNEVRVFAAITNSGSYIEPPVRKKLFTPFFTMKPNGTGLGLSIAHQIIRGHSGYIEVDSDPEEGTTFIIDLPTSEAVEKSSEEMTNANSHRA